MTSNISEHQVRVYLYAKSVGDWFTIQDLSTDTNVPDNSAKRHADRFEELGIFRRLRIAPNHLFRLVEVEDANARVLIDRIEEAAPVFESRRKAWLVREASAIGQPSPLLAGDDPASRPVQTATRPATSPASHTPSRPQPMTPPAASSAPPASAKASKVDLLFEMIGRPSGASLEELATTLGNQPHSVRATISVKSRERGLAVRCDNGRYFLTP